MYRHIAGVTLRIALLAPVIVYAVTAWNLHLQHVEQHHRWQKTEEVFECLEKVPEELLLASVKTHENFDARDFECTGASRDRPFWTNINEVRGDRGEPPGYWTEKGYRLEIIPLVSISVMLLGAGLVLIVWVVRWTLGLQSNAHSGPSSQKMNAWLMAIITSTLSALLAGLILSKLV